MTARESAVAEAAAELARTERYYAQMGWDTSGAEHMTVTLTIAEWRAILAALAEWPALGDDERAEALINEVAAACDRVGLFPRWAEALTPELVAILTARAHQPTPPEANDWPCDWPTSHPPHVAESWDDLGRLIGYTEFCHGGNPTARPPGPPRSSRPRQ